MSAGFKGNSYCFRRKRYLDCINLILSSLNIKKRELNYISRPESWNYFAYDLLAISFYKIKEYKKAVEFGGVAMNLKPHDERLKNNLKYYKLKLNKK